MKKIRNAARTIILNENNKIAVLSVNNGKYHKIPGGGLEKNENFEKAAIREALEESGCKIEIIQKIGESGFIDPVNINLEHYSICFLTKKVGENNKPNFTNEELEKKLRLLWLSFEEALGLFERVESSDPFELEMNDRDMNFVKIAKNLI